MDFVAQLWLPILLAAFACFILSSLAWTVLPHHWGDFKEIKNFDAFSQALKAQGLRPGF